MLKTIGLVLLVGVAIGILAELIRSVPDPDLWTAEGTGGVVVGVLAGAIAAAVVGSRRKNRR